MRAEAGQRRSSGDKRQLREEVAAERRGASVNKYPREAVAQPAVGFQPLALELWA